MDRINRCKPAKTNRILALLKAPWRKIRFLVDGIVITFSPVESAMENKEMIPGGRNIQREFSNTLCDPSPLEDAMEENKKSW